MSDTVDRRIVEMRFDNEQFEKNVGQTLITLDTLKKALEMSGAGKGFEEVTKASNRVDLSNVQNGVEETTKKFSALEVIAITALANITNSAVNAGKRLVSSFINPLFVGGKQRALNMEQAKFMFGGLTNMQTGLKYTAEEIGSVGKTGTIMDNLYNAVEGTFYSLDKAALIGSQLMAAGISGTSEDITKVLKGVAGVASMFGADYQRVGDIFVKVKTQGRLMGQDLMSLNTMGVPTIATITDYLNKMGDGAKYTQEQVSAMVSKGKIDFETFSGAMNYAFGEQAAKSKQLFTGAVEDMAAAMARIGEKLWKPLVGSGGLGVNFFNAMVPVIDNINTVLTPAFTAWGNAAQSLTKKLMPLIDVFGAIFDYDNTLAELKKLSSEDLKDVDGNYLVDPKRVKQLEKHKEAIEKLTAPFKALHEVLNLKDLKDNEGNDLISSIAGFYKVSPEFLRQAKAVQTAFESLKKSFKSGAEFLSNFGKVFSQVLVGGNSGGIRQLAYGLGLTNTELEHIYDIVGGLKSVANIIKTVFSTVANFIIKLITGVSGTLNSNTSIFRGFFDLILSILAAIGRFLSAIESPIKASLGLISEFGIGLSEIFGGVAGTLGTFIKHIADAFNSLNLSLEGIGEKLLPVIQQIVKIGAGAISSVFNALTGGFNNLGNAFEFFGKTVIGYGIFNVITGLRKYLEGIRRSGFAGLTQGLIALFGQGLDEFRLAMISLQTTFKVWQNSLKATVLLKLAIAIGILAVSLKVLASIPAKQLVAASAALAGLCGDLVAATRFLNPVKVSGLISLAISVRILAGAVKEIGEMKTGDLIKGVAAITVLLGALTLIAERMAKLNTKMWHMKKNNLGGLVIAIIGLAIAVKLLAGPIKKLGEMKLADLAKGVVAVSVLLGMLVGAMILLSNYLKLESKGLLSFLGKQAQLYALTAVMIMLAGALEIMAIVVKQLGSMDIASLAKGLYSIAALLGIIVGFVTLINLSGTLPGDMLAMGAMMIMFALAIKGMSKPVQEFASMNVKQLAKGLGALAVMLGEIWLFMIGMKGMGKKNMLTAAGSLIVVSVAIKILAGALDDLSNIKDSGNGLATLFGSLLILGAAIWAFKGATDGAVALIAVAGALMIMAPAIALLSSLDLEKVGSGLLALAGTLTVLFIAAGVFSMFPELIPILYALSGALALVGAGLFLMGAAVGAVGVGIYLLAEGLNMLVDLFTNTADAVFIVGKGLVDIAEYLGTAIGTAIISGMELLMDNKDTIVEYFGFLFDALIDVIVNKIPAINDAIYKMLLSLLETIRDNEYELTTVGIEIVVEFLNGVADRIDEVIDAGTNLVIQFINGVTAAIEEHGPEMRQAFWNLIWTSVTTFPSLGSLFFNTGTTSVANYVKGLKDPTTTGKLYDAADEVSDEVSTRVEVKSSTTEKYGINVLAGYIKGLDSKMPDLRTKANAIGDLVDKIIKKKNEIKSPSRRLMRTGEYLMMGLISGVDNYTSDYQNKADSISTMMIDSFNSAYGPGSSFQPVIDPIFGTADLSQLSASVNLGLDNKIQQERALAGDIASLTKSLNSMTDTMNSRSLNNYINIDGTGDPEAFADDLIRSFRLNARTI